MIMMIMMTTTTTRTMMMMITMMTTMMICPFTYHRCAVSNKTSLSFYLLFSKPHHYMSNLFTFKPPHLVIRRNTLIVAPVACNSDAITRPVTPASFPQTTSPTIGGDNTSSISPRPSRRYCSSSDGHIRRVLDRGWAATGVTVSKDQEKTVGVLEYEVRRFAWICCNFFPMYYAITGPKYSQPQFLWPGKSS